MTARAQVDSRHYRFGFLLESDSEFPQGFHTTEECQDFRIALFLPGDDAGWFGRSLFPPRIIFLTDHRLFIHTHASYREKPTCIELADLAFVESGRILLHGWLRFAWAETEITLLYNTRNSGPVRQFLAELRATLAPERDAPRPTHLRTFGEPLDIKFANAMASELAPGETVVLQFFSAARGRVHGWGILLREEWAPGDLLLISGWRLVWITDRYRGHHERYGTLARYAPLKSLAAAYLCPQPAGFDLVCEIRPRSRWSVPLPRDLASEARRFIEAAGAQYSKSRSTTAETLLAHSATSW